MYNIHQNYLYKLLLIFSANFIVPALSIRDNYENYNKMEFLHLCDPHDADSTPTLFLGSVLASTYHSAYILHPDYRRYRLSHRQNWNCTFFVQAQENEGIMASIQSMTFHSLSEACFDYVQFESFANNKSKKFCGKMRKKMPWASWDNLLNINYETFHDARNYNGNSTDLGIYDSTGKIKVTIFMDYGHRSEKLHRNLVIVFTAFKKYDEREEFLGSLSCPSSENNFCLNRKYECDGIKNCLSEFCNDEKNCKN